MPSQSLFSLEGVPSFGIPWFRIILDIWLESVLWARGEIGPARYVRSCRYARVQFDDTLANCLKDSWRSILVKRMEFMDDNPDECFLILDQWRASGWQPFWHGRFSGTGSPLLINCRIASSSSLCFQVADVGSLVRVATPYLDWCLSLAESQSCCSAGLAVAHWSSGISLVALQGGVILHVWFGGAHAGFFRVTLDLGCISWDASRQPLGDMCFMKRTLLMQFSVYREGVLCSGGSM